MVIILNCSNNLGGGGLAVSLSVVEECKKIPINTYHVFLGKNTGKQIDASSFPDNFTFYKIPFVKFWQLHKYLKPLEKKIKPDCVFTLFGPSYWKPNAPHVMGYAIPHYIYTDYVYIKRLPFPKQIRLFFRKIIRLYLFKYQSDYLIVQTEDAKNLLAKKLNINANSIGVVSNTCNAYYFNFRTYPNKLPDRKEDEIRLITISGYYDHKNLKSIPKVLEELKKRSINNINFVLTLKDDDYNKIIPEGWRHRVYNVGPIPAVECPSLYHESDILYLPTLLEVFSASYPEAMVMGKPILTSDLSFARSICGNAALYFNPYDIDDITNVIEEITSNRTLYQEYICRGKERLKLFPTAKQRAEDCLQLCCDLVERIRK
jgi:glycosyltransferase involved in cell wall biosynthesis